MIRSSVPACSAVADQACVRYNSSYSHTPCAPGAFGATPSAFPPQAPPPPAPSQDVAVGQNSFCSPQLAYFRPRAPPPGEGSWPPPGGGAPFPRIRPPRLRPFPSQPSQHPLPTPMGPSFGDYYSVGDSQPHAVWSRQQRPRMSHGAMTQWQSHPQMNGARDLPPLPPLGSGNLQSAGGPPQMLSRLPPPMIPPRGLQGGPRLSAASGIRQMGPPRFRSMRPPSPFRPPPFQTRPPR
ncbi:hypothetical protein AAHC03_026474 [Spirometra sp. Aus1]